MKRSHIDDKIAALAATGLPTYKRKPQRADHGGCSGKDRYPSEDAARANALMNGMAQRLDAYRCDECQFWHLTRRNK
jgi:hypothetical protein